MAEKKRRETTSASNPDEDVKLALEAQLKAQLASMKNDKLHPVSECHKRAIEGLIGFNEE